MSDTTSQTGNSIPAGASAKFPDSVNSQITDAVAQVNTKVLGDAPAMAMGNLFMATSQALSNAAHNATNSQQQSYVTMQAATTMGVSTLYALDTASTGVATHEIYQAQPSAKVEAPSPEALQSKLEAALEALNAARGQATSAVGSSSGSTKLAHTSEDFADAMRAAAGAFAVSLHAIGDSIYGQQMHIIQLAATAACLAAMIKSPDQAKNYEHILEIVKNLGD